MSKLYQSKKPPKSRWNSESSGSCDTDLSRTLKLATVSAVAVESDGVAVGAGSVAVVTGVGVALGVSLGVGDGVSLGASVADGDGCGVKTGRAVGFGAGFNVGFGVGAGGGGGVTSGPTAGGDVTTGVGAGGGGATVTPQGTENRTVYSFRPSAALYAPTPMRAQDPRMLALWLVEPMKAISIRFVATSSPHVLKPMFSPATLKQKPSPCMYEKTILLSGGISCEK